MTATNSRFSDRFFAPVSIAPLVSFRIIFGLLMLFGTTRFLLKGWVWQLYIQPEFHFTYLGFGWVKPLPGNWMYLPFALMILASLGIALGAFYRFSAVLFAVLFTYVELLDKTYYLNHYYFVSLVAFLMIFLPANGKLSVDSRRRPEITRQLVPAWTIFILRFQLGIVYIFAGIAKINSDWLLHAQPLRTWLQAFRDVPVLGTFFASSWLAFVFSWFGCIYDLTIPLFLSIKQTRTIAYVAVIVFHLLTWMLFPIGVFPWVMIFSTLIFFPAGFHSRIQRVFTRKDENIAEPKLYARRKHVTFLLCIYIVVQLAVPFRYLLYPGNLFWTEEGFRFSWRVMLMDKDGSATFFVVDRKSGESIEIRNQDYLSPAQEKEMSTQPDMILQFAHLLGRKFRDTVLHFGTQSVHLQAPRVEAEIVATLNGRPHQLFVSRKHDLMQEKYDLSHRKWIEEFQP